MLCVEATSSTIWQNQIFLLSCVRFEAKTIELPTTLRAYHKQVKWKGRQYSKTHTETYTFIHKDHLILNKLSERIGGT